MNQLPTVIARTASYTIEEHPCSGFRFLFDNYVQKGYSTKQATIEVLGCLQIEFQIFEYSILIVVQILSGQFKGQYDASFDFQTGAFCLFQDRG